MKLLEQMFLWIFIPLILVMMWLPESIPFILGMVIWFLADLVAKDRTKNNS